MEKQTAMLSSPAVIFYCPSDGAQSPALHRRHPFHFCYRNRRLKSYVYCDGTFIILTQAEDLFILSFISRHYI